MVETTTMTPMLKPDTTKLSCIQTLTHLKEYHNHD